MSISLLGVFPSEMGWPNESVQQGEILIRIFCPESKQVLTICNRLLIDSEVFKERDCHLAIWAGQIMISSSRHAVILATQ